MGAFDRFIKFVKTSLLAGIGIVLPIALCVVLFVKLVTTAKKVTEPIANSLFPENAYLHSYATEIVTLGLLVLASMLLGFIASTNPGQRFGKWVESRTLMHFGLYRSFKDFSSRLIPSDKNTLFQPALLIREDEMITLMFVVEDLRNGYFVIFMPSAPSTFSGSLHVVPKTDVEILQVPVMDVVKTFSRWGVGTGKVLEKSRYFELRSGYFRGDSLDH
jgi:uncharacterized membrane protein